MSVGSEINSLLEEERIIEERIKELEEEYGTETGEPVARKECDISSYEEQIKKYEEEREEKKIEEKKQNWISLINEEIEKAENEIKALGTVCDLGQTYIRESKQK